jgi:thiol-disulfide isomerase/thioredoxin
MKKNKILLMLSLVLILIPFTVNALSSTYVDKVYNIVDEQVEENKINLYLFYGDGCPHCAKEEKFLDELEKKYKDSLNVYRYETWKNEKNKELMLKAKETFGVDKILSVPFTVIGEESIVGYSDSVGDKIEKIVIKYLDVEEPETETETETIIEQNTEDIPLLGEVNIRETSIFIIAIVLGLLDGFNPCAMWILLFLINMFFGMKDRKKAWILGMAFLFVSGLVYFLSMLGINFVLSIATIKWMKILIALFILVAGVLNFKKYLKIRNEEAGCTVVDNKKRKKLITRMKKIMESKTFLLSLIGIMALAVSVNLIELACSLGFPLIFTEILAINGIVGVTRILYLLLYIFFYMIDDMVVFAISMITVEATGITNKYNKLCTLISAIIMILMGILLLFKPEWLMLNF